MKSLLTLTFLVLIMLPFQLTAGWVITGRYIDREGNTTFKRYFIQDDDVKVERYNLIYSINLKTENIILVDPENLVYTKTSFKAYSAKMKDIKIKRLNELLGLIPDDQKMEYERKYRAEIEQDVFLSITPGHSLSITALPDTSKLLGYQTAKFNFSENGLKKEEFFFTTDVDISADMDMGVFLKYVYLLEPEDKTTRYMASETYLDMIKNGLVLRRYIFQDGFRSEWQVNQVEQKKLPAYEFGVPALCKEVTLDKWLVRKNNTDEQYYDDYE